MIMKTILIINTKLTSNEKRWRARQVMYDREGRPGRGGLEVTSSPSDQSRS